MDSANPTATEAPRTSPLRRKLMLAVTGLIAVGLFTSLVAIDRVTYVNRALGRLNSEWVPYGRALTQLQTDSEVYRREIERGLHIARWKDPFFRPRPMPKWVDSLVESDLERLRENAKSSQARIEWVERTQQLIADVRTASATLYKELERRDETAIGNGLRIWQKSLDELSGWITSGVEDYERHLREELDSGQARIQEVRAGLGFALGVTLLVSGLLILWGKQALNPLAEFTKFAGEIARRGPRKSDKAPLPELYRGRGDEIGELAREFHAMATALIERERVVEEQKTRLQEQNRILAEYGELQRKLRVSESLAAVGRMSAQVAHEIRNPLHSLGLEAELALELAAKQSVHPALVESGDTSALKQSILTILITVDRLTKITGNYLKLSRPQSEPKHPVCILEVLQSVLSTYAPECESFGISVKWNADPAEELMVLGDPEQLEQALGNLHRNAIQALSEGEAKSHGEFNGESSGEPNAPKGAAQIKQIEWSLRKIESGRVLVTIRDNGPGISEQQHDKVFEPFFTTRAQGSGLGLPYVQKIITEVGGEIKLIRSADRIGAQFNIQFPLLSLPEVEA